MKTTLIIGMAAAGMAALSGCSPENPAPTQVVQTAVERELSTLETEAVSEQMEERAYHPEGCMNSGMGIDQIPLPPCAESTDSGPGTNPRIIAITFPAGCTEASGSFVLTLTQADPEAPSIGDSRVAEFTNFQIGSRSLTGTRTRTVVALDENGEPSIAIENALSFEHAWGQVNQVGNGAHVWSSGYTTPMECADNLWTRDFIATWTGPQGNSTTRVAEGLVHDGSCGHFTAGTVTITRPFHQFTIDFGDGACDAWATVTHGDTVYELNLETHEMTPL